MKKILIITSIVLGIAIMAVVVWQSYFPTFSFASLHGTVREQIEQRQDTDQAVATGDEAALEAQPTAWRDYFSYESDPEFVYKKYLLATYLYTKHKEIKAIPLAIAYATQLGKFDEAAKLLKELPDLKVLNELLDPHAMMRLLFNTADLSFKHLKHLKELVTSMTQEGRLTKEDYNFYFALLTIVKGDMVNTRYYLDQLSGSQYRYLRQDFQTLYQLKKQYTDVADYYLQAMLGMTLYKQGRRGISLHIGNEILTQDRDYLLAHQLVAYSSMSLQSRKVAIQELQRLQEIHPEYADVYQFFQAISHYFQGKYASSVSVFQQVPKQSSYFHDALRYLFLSYIALGDIAKAGQTATELLQVNDLVVADIYTIFDLFFYKPLKEEKPFTLYEFFPHVIDDALHICQERFSEFGYVCLYGKAGKMIVGQEEEKALRLLEGVVKWYPRAELYEYIGDLYRRQGDQKIAQERYQQAFLLAESISGGSDIQHSLEDTLSK